MRGLLILTVSSALAPRRVWRLGRRRRREPIELPEAVDLTVSAASSLTAAFTDIGAAFEDANPGVTVTFNFGPSDGLATQINEGAPVDVFASASPTWMDAVQDEVLASRARRLRAQQARDRRAVGQPCRDREPRRPRPKTACSSCSPPKASPRRLRPGDLRERRDLGGGARERRLERGGREGRHHEGARRATRMPASGTSRMSHPSSRTSSRSSRSPTM